ncbi:hypothetical protein GCM10010094_50090 [Streptomyces flaveus]|uniref:Uncharacterized protein n=1 Tax=Streptomyces flaveus TaxID=66370 RepID=A0A917R0U7_9ACTN|nr:hypothetical protein GCM10010094_50090 [Streptomyces flaveus]
MVTFMEATLWTPPVRFKVHFHDAIGDQFGSASGYARISFGSVRIIRCVRIGGLGCRLGVAAAGRLGTGTRAWTLLAGRAAGGGPLGAARARHPAAVQP